MTGGGAGACCVGGPGEACGGAGTACCEANGSMVTGVSWNYVGMGRGDYAPAPNAYSYVGQGGGAYIKEVQTTPVGCKPRPCCLALLALLLLIGLLWLLLDRKRPEPEDTDEKENSEVLPPIIIPDTPPPTPAPTPAPRGSCVVWGDPHVTTFDGKHADYYTPGEYWVVKSEKVKIQGRYLPTKVTNGLACTNTLAISGPVIGNRKLMISAESTTLDGAPILTAFPSRYDVPGVMELTYDNKGVLLQTNREGKPLHIVHIFIHDGTPEGLLIQVNRWMEPSEGNYINVKITMNKQPGQDGHCGNFNGIDADDDRLEVRKRMGTQGVPTTELLFNTKTPVKEAGRPDINDCEPEKLDKAHETCKQIEKTFIPSMSCLIDVCFGGLHQV